MCTRFLYTSVPCVPCFEQDEQEHRDNIGTEYNTSLFQQLVRPVDWDLVSCVTCDFGNMYTFYNDQQRGLAPFLLDFFQQTQTRQCWTRNGRALADIVASLPASDPCGVVPAHFCAKAGLLLISQLLTTMRRIVLILSCLVSLLVSSSVVGAQHHQQHQQLQAVEREVVQVSYSDLKTFAEKNPPDDKTMINCHCWYWY
jgi:hypothetical protein